MDIIYITGFTSNQVAVATVLTRHGVLRGGLDDVVIRTVVLLGVSDVKIVGNYPEMAIFVAVAPHGMAVFIDATKMLDSLDVVAVQVVTV